ncbi:MAG: hypothetical protein Q9190_001176 [Brigantiaea leucoxantha]
MVSAFSGSRLTTNSSPDVLEIAKHLPQVVLWIWSTLLLETISNQRLASSIVEDSINKPWRPLPAQRLTRAEARQLLIVLIPLVFLTSFLLGGHSGLQATIALQIFSYMYNDLGGADENFIVRNILNACGLTCFSVGAAIVATGSADHSLNQWAHYWMALLGTVITSTVQTQDLPDMEGDRKRGRRTIPLIYGEDVARWSVAVTVVVWSILCPAFWQLSFLGYLPPVVVGIVLSTRVILLRNVRSDEISWKMWCAWMMVLYLLPLF